MAARIAPLFAGERRAAELFDMSPAEFLRLVDDGHLPGPKIIGGLKRWDVDELRAIARGDSMDGGGMTW